MAQTPLYPLPRSEAVYIVHRLQLKVQSVAPAEGSRANEPLLQDRNGAQTKGVKFGHSKTKLKIFFFTKHPSLVS